MLATGSGRRQKARVPFLSTRGSGVWVRDREGHRSEGAFQPEARMGQPVSTESLQLHRGKQLRAWKRGVSLEIPVREGLLGGDLVALRSASISKSNRKGLFLYRVAEGDRDEPETLQGGPPLP